MIPAGPKQAKVRTPRQAQRRLSPEQVEQLVKQYRTGKRVNSCRVSSASTATLSQRYSTASTYRAIGEASRRSALMRPSPRTTQDHRWWSSAPAWGSTPGRWPWHCEAREYRSVPVEDGRADEAVPRAAALSGGGHLAADT